MAPDPSRPLVLVVDDQPRNVQFLGQLLENGGFDVLPANGGAQALARAEARPPDLVLLDLIMAPMDGFDVARHLRALPAAADVPVIFLTASTDRGAVARGFAAGAVDYVAKPVLVEELMARIRMHLELKRARDRLAAMLREREDVVRVVAHDLKNPLTSILFNAQLMAGSRDDGRDGGIAEDIRQAASEALDFIERFLAREGEGERLRQLGASPLDLQALAAQALQRLQGAAVAHGVELRLCGEPMPVPVHADAVATRNVLQNLLRNAIRYSPKGATVEVVVGAGRAGYSQCLVLDRGPGIAPADQGRLFQRFVRLAAAADGDESAAPGSGLGLAIAKHDITRMGGFLWYETRAGGGSVFGFELPQAAARAPA